MNQDQTKTFITILKKVNQRPGLFVVDGTRGTGKTFLHRALLVRSEGMIELAFATTSMEAAILPGGRTTHSRFGIPLQANETTITHMSKHDRGSKLIRK